MEKRKGLNKAIQEVLSTAQEPMRAPAIWHEILRRELREDGELAYPINQVSGWLADGISGDPPLYDKVAHGLYRLHPAQKAVAGDDLQSQEPGAPEESRLIHAFGILWDRDKVQWDSKPKLWGRQGGNEEVDFGDQPGIYILYHFNKVVYVGRADKQGIGKRLKDWTKDRSKEPWNRFSWFAISELESGQLTQKSIIADLEALLIEFADPPRNNKKGDGLPAFEYLQA